MNQTPKYQEGLHYSDEVKNAVRYGYFYRKDAEKNKSFHACIADTSDILLWLANVIIGGFAWDIIKSVSKKLYRRLKNNGIILDDNVEQVLNDETELYKYVVFIREFNEQRMFLDDEKLRYIKEEINADYVGKKLGRIMSQENREANNEEIVEIYKESSKIADSILGISGKRSF